MAMKQGINIAVLGTAGVIGVLMVVIVFIGVQAFLGYELARETSLKWDNTPIQPVTGEKEAMQAKLSSYRWVDRQKHTVAIPITEAMKIMIADHGKLPSTQPAKTAELSTGLPSGATN